MRFAAHSLPPQSRRGLHAHEERVYKLVADVLWSTRFDPLASWRNKEDASKNDPFDAAMTFTLGARSPT
jgi:hypothetical protein